MARTLGLVPQSLAGRGWALSAEVKTAAAEEPRRRAEHGRAPEAWRTPRGESPSLVRGERVGQTRRRPFTPGAITPYTGTPAPALDVVVETFGLKAMPSTTAITRAPSAGRCQILGQSCVTTPPALLFAYRLTMYPHT